MKIVRFKNYIYCVIAGFVISFFDILLSLIAYIDISIEIFSVVLVLIFISGNIAMIFTLNFKKPTIVENIFRFILTVLSALFFVIINGYLGFSLFLHELLNLNATDSADNVSGLISLMFFLTLIAVGAICLVVTAFIKSIRGRFKNNQGTVL